MFVPKTLRDDSGQQTYSSSDNYLFAFYTSGWFESIRFSAHSPRQKPSKGVVVIDRKARRADAKGIKKPTPERELEVNSEPNEEKKRGKT